MRSSYDRSFDPPAPVVRVSVQRPATPGSEVHRITALLDTGADITFLPPDLVQAIDPPVSGEGIIESVSGGSVGPISTYLVEFDLGGHREVVEVVALGDEAIAGRNWLNCFHVTLDGPQQELTIAPPGGPPAGA